MSLRLGSGLGLTSRAGLCLTELVTDRYGVCGHFFFFQAEDGIRDLTVTGVQTCALPIFESGQLPPKVGDNPRSRETPAGPLLERLQGKENRTGVGRVRECSTIEADKRGRVDRKSVV